MLPDAERRKEGSRAGAGRHWQGRRGRGSGRKGRLVGLATSLTDLITRALNAMDEFDNGPTLAEIAVALGFICAIVIILWSYAC